jgi:hypothetical protein
MSNMAQKYPVRYERKYERKPRGRHMLNMEINFQSI